jgi:hypothetical protein
MSRCLAKWVVPGLAQLFRLLAVFTEPLLGNGRLVPTPLLRLLGVMSQYIEISRGKLTGDSTKLCDWTGLAISLPLQKNKERYTENRTGHCSGLRNGIFI